MFESGINCRGDGICGIVLFNYFEKKKNSNHFILVSLGYLININVHIDEKHSESFANDLITLLSGMLGTHSVHVLKVLNFV